jgi:tRNA-dihydrouridine synthase
MDANLTTADIDFINNLRNNGRKSPVGMVRDCQIYQNNYRTPTADAKTVYITDNRYSIIRQIIKALKQGLRCYVADNGNVDNIIALKKMLTKKDCKTLVICQNTLHHQNVKDALKDPNEEFGKYNLVICSPSVQSGVSYDQFKDLATGELTVPFDSTPQFTYSVMQTKFRNNYQKIFSTSC